MTGIMHDIIHGGQDTRVVEVRRARTREMRKVPFGFNPRTETPQITVESWTPSPTFGFRGSK